MRQIVSYSAKEAAGGVVTITRCLQGSCDSITTSDWIEAIRFLTSAPASDSRYFTVCFNLRDFTEVLFSLLPDEKRQTIINEDKIVHENVKVFYVNGRYLGLTAALLQPESFNVYRKQELNLQALKWWLSENELEPVDAVEVAALGEKIVKTLDVMGIVPTKLTSPVAVFMDSHFKGSKMLPTVFNFPREKQGAMDYASKIMRHEWRAAYKVGHVEESYQYDQVSAYPSAMMHLPSTTNSRCEYATTLPSWAQWGVMKGRVTVDADISPLVYERDGEMINPKGSWDGYFTTGEIKWLEKWNAGTFSLEDGWFFSFDKERPYREAMTWLYRWKQHPDAFTSTIAKKMSQGVSGKLDEDRQDGMIGDYYNPVLALMTRSYARLKVADFIYQNKLQDDVMAVLVDSVLSTRKVSGVPDNGGMGSWRYEGCLPALVLSKGMVWRPGKRPQGITYEQITKAMVDEPEAGYYTLHTNSGRERVIDLLLGNDERDFTDYPACGGQVMSGVSSSTAWDISE